RIGRVEAVGQVVVAVPAGEEDVAHAGLADHLEWVLALPLARIAAQQHERRGPLEALVRARPRADQERQALYLGVTADVQQDRAVERVEVVVGIRDAALLPGVRVPAPGLLYEPAPPQLAPPV